MQSLDDLLAKWRLEPGVEVTLALCARVAQSRRQELGREIDELVRARYARDRPVLLAVGRMHLALGLLNEAQGAFVAAGKAEARDPVPFRYLGEVLLRRGDAQRALKVFDRARALGSTDPAVTRWEVRAASLVPLQERSGAGAVAREVRDLSDPGLSEPLPQWEVKPEFKEDEEPTLMRWGSASAPSVQLLETERAPPQAGREPAGEHADWSWLDERPTLPRGQRERTASSRRERREGPPSIEHGESGLLRASLESADLVELEGPSNPESPEPGPASGTPDTHGILAELARVGVFERQVASPPTWEAPPRRRATGFWLLAIATTLLGMCASLALFHVHAVQARRAAGALAECERAEELLTAGAVPELRAAEERLGRVFALDPRSVCGSELWLRNRVQAALMLPGDPRGLDAAIRRAQVIGIGEERLAYAQIVSFLAAGDVEGSLASIDEWDGHAAGEALYQLAVGVALERVGDPAALARYEAAHALAPDLLLADLQRTRLALLERGPGPAQAGISRLRTRLGSEAPIVRALNGLGWVLTTVRGDLPPAARLDDSAVASLPVSLAPVPYLVRATQSIDRNEPAHASEQLDLGLSQCRTPAEATQFGVLALRAGDELLAYRAATRALAFSSTYPGARVLASEVALLRGDLEQAQRAVARLDPESSQVAVTAAVVAYEELETEALQRALGALERGRANLSDEHATFRIALESLAGRQVPDQAEKLQDVALGAGWGELIGVDVATEGGNVDLARALVRGWKRGALERPLYALRAARLDRLQNRLMEADRVTRTVVQHTPTRRAIIERIYLLLAMKEGAKARALVREHGRRLNGGGWAEVLVAGSVGDRARATILAAPLALPEEGSPWPLRVLAARALAVTYDRRAPTYLRDLLQVQPGNPELQLASNDMTSSAMPH